MVKLTPGSCAEVDVLTSAGPGWRWATIRHSTCTMTSLSATEHSPTVSAQPLSQSSSVFLAWRAHIHQTHTYYKLFKWALCLLLGRVNRESGGEGRQRGRVLGERGERGGADEQRSCCKVLWLAGVIILQRWRHWMHTGQLPPLRLLIHSRATVGREREREQMKRERGGRGERWVGVIKWKEACLYLFF